MANAKLLDIPGSMYVPYVMLADPTGAALVVPSSGALTGVLSSATDVVVLVANTSRKGVIIYNDSTAVLYLMLATGTSSATSYSIQVPAGGNFTLNPGEYTGIIKGTWASVNGSARVTEFS